MKNRPWHIDNPQNCPMVGSLSIIAGKWKPIILHMLSSGSMRFGELKKNIPPVSHKVLTEQLRELEADGVLLRKVYAEVPPKTEYSLSEQGVSLVPILDALYEWGQKHAVVASDESE